MPIDIRYLDNGIGVLYIGQGIVTGDEIIKSNRNIFSSKERMEKLKYGFIDYSNITQLSVSNSEIEIIASQDKKASEYIPDAVVAVAAKRDFEFGLNRMWEIVVENTGLQWKTMIFRERDATVKWIKQKVKEKYNIDLTMA